MIGCLVEKQLTTPQQYPLTLNALVLACNQSSNRDPVVSYDEPLVQRTLASLKEENLVRFVYPSSGRSATRYRQVIDQSLALRSRLSPCWRCCCCAARRPSASCGRAPSGCPASSPWVPSQTCSSSWRRREEPLVRTPQPTTGAERGALAAAAHRRARGLGGRRCLPPRCRHARLSPGRDAGTVSRSRSPPRARCR